MGISDNEAMFRAMQRRMALDDQARELARRGRHVKGVELMTCGGIETLDEVEWWQVEATSGPFPRKRWEKWTTFADFDNPAEDGCPMTGWRLAEVRSARLFTPKDAVTRRFDTYCDMKQAEMREWNAAPRLMAKFGYAETKLSPAERFLGPALDAKLAAKKNGGGKKTPDAAPAEKPKDKPDGCCGNCPKPDEPHTPCK